MYIFIDDYRVPADVTWVDLPTVDWAIVSSYEEFEELLNTLDEEPCFIAFDHDLADAHYNGDFSNPDEKTGYDCAKLLVEHCMDKNWRIPAFEVHSLNPVGAENIRAYLENAKKYMKP